MGIHQLKIELLSDMCVSDGGAYNSALDTDICYDEYGFPFIPAKRIKGCLRECALELNDWGKTIPVARLFGDKGSRQALLRVGNAYPENYVTMKEEIKEHADHMVFHPQNVLNHFSYIRTQTSIDYETGAAEEASLRTMRVADKGLVFLAEVELKEESLLPALKECCAVFTNIGIARTRGLGEIRVTLEEKRKPDVIEAEEFKAAEANRLEYVIELEEPVICKSIDGGETKTQDYIEGSKILGLIAQRLKRADTDFIEFMNSGNLICSNAYISYGSDAAEEKRCAEVPASFYSIKNDKEHYINKLYENEESRKAAEGKQLNMMKHCYVCLDTDGDLVKRDVGIEERYHHSRPADKSIGRAVEDASGESVFYQMASIKSGQRFKGYIVGTEEQIKQVYEMFMKEPVCYLGYGKSSEYGKVRLEVLEVLKQDAYVLKGCRDLAIKLEAPAILYNQNAFYSTDANDLIQEINSILQLQEEEFQVDKFLNYIVVGGFNVTWGRRKPTIGAFDKGTVLFYHFPRSVDIRIPAHLFMGERNAEGYGEFSVEKIDVSQNAYIGSYEKVRSVNDETERLRLDGSTSFAWVLCRELFEEFIAVKAVGDAKQFLTEDDMKATISNMIQICKDSDSYKQIIDSTEARYGKKSERKQKKLAYAQEILENVSAYQKQLIRAFEDHYEIMNFEYDEDRYQCEYLTAFLIALKYKLKKSDSLKKGEN